jgi:hypothetical protein
VRHPVTASALFALALVTATAAGQPKPDPAPNAKTDKAEPKPSGPKADSTDAAIAAALANDPDVKMARAKIQLAEAELAKARLAVAQKVTSLKSAIDLHKSEIEIAEPRVRAIGQAFAGGGASATDFDEARRPLARAKAALAAAEAELKLLTGGAGGPGPIGAAGDPNAQHAASALEWLGKNHPADGERATLLQYGLALQLAYEQLRPAVKGPVPDRLRALLDKPVKLGPKGTKLTFAQALEVLKKEAGWDVPIRGGFPANQVYRRKDKTEAPTLVPIEIVSEGEELPIGAWLQWFEDQAIEADDTGVVERSRFYVRDYGLIASNRTFAPPDAPTLHEFWKGKPEPKK